jgi:hypothetical protein
MKRPDITDEYLRAPDLTRRKPDLPFLCEITRCHAARLAFSSIGPLLGDDLPLDIESLYKRIIVSHYISLPALELCPSGSISN